MFAKLLVTALILWMNLSLSIGQDSTTNDEVYEGINAGNETDQNVDVNTDYEQLEQNVDTEYDQTEQNIDANTDYEQLVVVRWRIENPPTVEYDDLSLNINFAVSDYVQARKHVRYEIYLNPECGNPDHLITDEDGFMETTVSEDNTPFGPGIDESIKKRVTISNKLNPQAITESESFQETGSDSSITFCVLFSLWNGEGPSDPFATKISHLAVTTGLTLDLDNDFEITAKNIEAKGVKVEIANDQFFVQAFFCDENGEPPTLVAPLRQGRIARVCVEPTDQASEVGFRMQSLDKFTYVQGSTSQVAVADGEAAENGLTELYCKQGAMQCIFETYLFSYFFLNNADGVQDVIVGNGVATLQWGGEGVDRQLLEPLTLDDLGRLHAASIGKDVHERRIKEESDEEQEQEPEHPARILRDRTSQRTIEIPAFAIVADGGSERPPLRVVAPTTQTKTQKIILLLLLVLFCVVISIPSIYVYQSRRIALEQQLYEEEEEEYCMEEERERERELEHHNGTLSISSLVEGDTSSVSVDDEKDIDDEKSNDPRKRKNDRRWRLSKIPEDRSIISSARSLFSRRVQNPDADAATDASER